MNTATHFKTEDGRPAVRLERTYPHPIERVWKAVTDPRELASWFPSKVEMQLAKGARIRFYGDPNMPEDTHGEILVLEPPKRLEFSWADSELHFELVEVGPEETRFTLTNLLAKENESARNAAGWDVCLQGLDKALTGHSDDAKWKELYEGYVDQGFPKGAPIPGQGSSSSS